MMIIKKKIKSKKIFIFNNLGTVFTIKKVNLMIDRIKKETLLDNLNLLKYQKQISGHY